MRTDLVATLKRGISTVNKGSEGQNTPVRSGDVRFHACYEYISDCDKGGARRRDEKRRGVGTDDTRDRE